MEQLLKKVAGIIQRNRKRKWVKAGVMSAACFVVFVTTYALILPAITISLNQAEEEPGFDVASQGELLNSDGEPEIFEGSGADEDIDNSSGEELLEGDSSRDNIFGDEGDVSALFDGGSNDGDEVIFSDSDAVDSNEMQASAEETSGPFVFSYSNETTTWEVSAKLLNGAALPAGTQMTARIVSPDSETGTDSYTYIEKAFEDALTDAGLTEDEEPVFYQLAFEKDGEELITEETHAPARVTFHFYETASPEDATIIAGEYNSRTSSAQMLQSVLQYETNGYTVTADLDNAVSVTGIAKVRNAGAEESEQDEITFENNGIVENDAETSAIETELQDTTETETVAETEEETSPVTEPEEYSAEVSSEEVTEEITEKVTEEITEEVTEQTDLEETEEETESVSEEETEVQTETVTEEETEIVFEEETEALESIYEDEQEEETESITEEETEEETESISEEETEELLSALTFEGADYTIQLTYGADAEIPEDAFLDVREIEKGSDEYNMYLAASGTALEEEGKANGSGEHVEARFFDITIMHEDQKIEPKGRVSVDISYHEALAVAEDGEVNAVHFDESGESATVLEATPQGEGSEVSSVSFDTDSFSVFGIVYTVDFHWEVDGKTFEYSLAGGDSISFRKLMEELNVVGKKETPGCETDQFIDDVELVEFSDESLVKVIPVTEGISAGALKEAFGLKCEYSSDVTEAQIQAMDARIFYPADWALISLKAFDSIEYLTVTMKNGEQFRVTVTDAQITRDFITASGETYTITVIFGEDAEIPEEADLRVEEILPGTQKYAVYMKQSETRLNLETGGLSFARFFDIEIIDQEGNQVEPKAPVQVAIAYKNAVEVSDGESLRIIHFADKGPEVIDDISLSQDGKNITYLQDSFSVTGTIVGRPSNGQQRMIILKDGNRYFIVNNDATLTEVGYEDGTVSVVEPMLWTFGGNNIYFNSEATGFNINYTASDWYRRYLDPESSKGVTEEVRSGSEGANQVGVTVTVSDTWENPNDHQTVEVNSVTNRTNAVNQTSVSIDTADGVSTIRHGNTYFGIERDENGTPVKLIPQTGDTDRAQFIFAEASNVPSGVHLQNAVNHIDIAIQGNTEVKVPLAYGTYYLENGEEVHIIENTDVTLTKEQAVNQNDLKITAEDMKRATIMAYDKEGNEVNDAFYITGFSQNATTNLSEVQVRIEGSFKVAQPEKDNPAYKTIDGNRYDGNWWAWQMPDQNYVNAVRQARLNNIIDYRLTVVKPVKYQLVDSEGRKLYADANGTPLYVSIDVAFSGAFNYWDYGESERNYGNECPPLENNAAWRAGDIPNHDLSGMDFRLRGYANDEDSPLIAIEIMKRIVDEKGNLIVLGEPVTNYVDVYENKDADRNAVKDYKIDPVDGINPNRDNAEGLYDDYTFLRDEEITIEAGTAQKLIYDYNVSNAMYYIQERNGEQDLPDTIKDSHNEEWKYVKTYIETEYVRRGYGGYDDTTVYHNPMHVSDDYYRGDDYKSSPEVLGVFKPVTGDVKKSTFLEYFIYNVYTKGKMLEVEKKWLPQDGVIPEGAQVTIDLYYAKAQDKAFPANKDEYVRVVAGEEPFDADLKTTITLTAANNWQDVFDGLPETYTEGDTVYDLDYYAKEVSVKIPGTGETEINENAIDITKAYNVSATINNGKEIITNEREKVSLDAEKRWAEGTEIPEGAEVTLDLRYAVRTAVTADGIVIADAERDEWPVKSEYMPVCTEGVYSDPFVRDPGIDETKIMTELHLSAEDAVGDVWSGVYSDLPGYLIAEDGSILEVDYYAVETAVRIPAEGRTVVDEDAVDVTGDYLITTQKTDGGGTDSDGKVTVTNTQNETSLDVHKIWGKGSEVPEGTKIKVKLTFAARMITDKDGLQITPLDGWPEKSEYKDAATGSEDVLAVEETDSSFKVTGLTVKAQTELEIGADTVNPEKSWNGSFKSLPKYLRDTEGNIWELDYFAVETAVNVPGADSTVEDRIAQYIHTEVKTEASAQDVGISDGTVTITNKENIIVNVRKEWEPLPEGGEAVVQLKRYKAGQTPDQIKTEATVVKVWDDAEDQDGKRPESLGVTLSGGETNSTVTLNAENSWKATVTGLQAYDAEGDEISYIWTEAAPEGYSLTSTVTRGNITTLTNSYTPGKTSATVRIDWQDGGNRDAYRPETVVAVLDQNGQKVTLSAENEWTATITGLPEYKEGRRVTYTWTAENWTSGNQAKYTGDGKSEEEGGQQSKIPYTHVPEKTEMKVQIVWDDNNNEDGSRPEGVTASIVDHPGTETVLNAGNSWNGSIELYKYENGEETSYTWTNPIIAGYTQTSRVTESDGTLVMTYHHDPIPPKDYVTVTVHTVLREASEGYYTNWETNGWNTNIYNLSATFEGNSVAIPNGMNWNSQDYILRAPLSFDVDKNSNVSFHINIGGTDVSLVDIGANGSTLTQSGTANARDVSFTAGTTDVDLYVVLKGAEEKLPEYSTVYMVVSNGGESSVSKDPTNYIKKIIVPVNTDVSFNYDSYYYEPWNQTINPKYKVFYWHDTQYEHKWEAVSPEISGEGAPDEDIVFNVGMKERYLILLDAASNFGDNFNAKLVSLAAGNNQGTNSVQMLSASPRKSASAKSVMSSGMAVQETEISSAAYSTGTPAMTTPYLVSHTNSRLLAAGNGTGTTAVKTSLISVPDGYEKDTAFDTPAVTLTLKDGEGFGWEQSFPEQDKYDQWGREYIYYVEEISFSPADYITEAITGDPNNGETVVIRNKKDEPQTGSVKVTKSFDGIESLPAGFTIMASYTDADGAHMIPLTTASAGMTGTGTSDDPYTWTMNDLPIGTEVTFTETGFTAEGYSVTINGSATASPVTAVAAQEPGIASFVNAYTKNPGDLELTKVIDGEGASSDKEFEFTIELTAPAGKTLDASYAVVHSGDASITSASITDGKIIVRLKGGQTFTIKSLPIGTGYSITEAEYSLEGYTPSVTNGSLSGTISGGLEVNTVTVTNTYSAADITVIKIDETTRNDNDPASQKTIPGAKFKLYRLTVPEGGGTETYTVYPDAESCEKTTGTDGILKYEKLPNGKYKLEESKVPDGYVSQEKIELYFTVAAGSNVIWTDSEGTELTEQNMVSYAPEEKTFTVGNTPGAALPNTGGPGTKLIYLLGITLISLASMGFVVKRRRRNTA